MSLVSLAGTAFAIFLVMSVVTVSRSGTAPYPPVSKRSEILYARGVDISFENGSRSAAYSYAYANEIYSDLPGSDAFALHSWLDEYDVAVRGSSAFEVNLRRVSSGYWQIFDFTFLSGTPIPAAAEGMKYDASTPVVISESVARKLYGTTDAAGREIMVGHKPRRVCGVVKDVTPLADMAYSQVWAPVEGPETKTLPVAVDDFFGEYQVVVALSPGIDAASVKAEAVARYEAAARRLAADGNTLNTHGQPFTLAEFKSPRGTNSDPQEQSMWKSLLVYAILLIVPAINLSAMTQSFLRKRRTEFGVRRSFGATRGRLLGGIFMENLLVTAAGSLLGLVASWIFLLLFAKSFLTLNTWETVLESVTVSPALLFSWSTFGLAVLFSLVLNTMSVGFPAFSAARVNPVEAISGHDD